MFVVYETRWTFDIFESMGAIALEVVIRRVNCCWFVAVDHPFTISSESLVQLCVCVCVCVWVLRVD
jgi:hypothetical protein